MNEIGRRLRAAREARGIALEVAEDETKIRRKYIEALEAGQEAVLPGDAYVKGFLRTYGNYLGLDGTALVEEYKQRKEQVSLASAPENGAPVAAHTAGATPRSGLTPEERASRRAERVRESEQQAAPKTPVVSAPKRPRRPLKQDSPSGRTLGLAAIVVALVGAVVYLGWLIFSQATPAPKTDVPPAVPPTASSQPEPAPPPKLPDPPKVTMSQPSATEVVFSVPAKDVTLTIEPTEGNVWLQPMIDGQQQKDVTTAKSVEFKGKEIRLRMGHMNGVSLIVNGQRFDKPLEGGPFNLLFKGQ